MNTVDVLFPAGPNEVFAFEADLLEAGTAVTFEGVQIGELLEVLEITPKAIRARLVLFGDLPAGRISGFLPLELEDHPELGPFVSVNDVELALHSLAEAIAPIFETFASILSDFAARIGPVLEDLVEKFDLLGIVNPRRARSSSGPDRSPFPPVKDLRATSSPKTTPPRPYRRR